MSKLSKDGTGPQGSPGTNELSGPKTFKASTLVVDSLSSPHVSIQFVIGPISDAFEGTVCALDRSQLFGVFGDMTKAPRLANVQTPHGGDPNIESIHSDPRRSLKYVFVEDWRRVDEKSHGNARAIERALTLANEVGAVDVVVALPNCGGQYYFSDWEKSMGGHDPDRLSPEEASELRQYCLGTKAFLDRSSNASISRITFVWSEHYQDQLRREDEQQPKPTPPMPALDRETFPRRIGRIIRALLPG